jgi:hypothetical protein
MDDLVRTGLVIIVIFCITAAIVLYGIIRLFLLELHALAAGDAGFILASIAGVLLFCTGYIGTGLWLRRMGRI